MTDATSAAKAIPPAWLVEACKPWVVQMMPDGYNSVFGLTGEEVAQKVWPRLTEAIQHLEAIHDVFDADYPSEPREHAVAALALLRGDA